MRCTTFGRAVLLAGAALTVSFTTARVPADVVSTFDTDSDGWTPFQNAGAPFDWIPSGGNPGGHIAATDKTADWAYIQAPAKFLAPAPYGGTFSFDLRVDNLLGSPAAPGVYNVRVGLQGAGLTLINEGGLPTTSWANYAFTLDESFSSGWRVFSNLSQNYSPAAALATPAEMQAVLANLTRVAIATDYTNSALDNNVPGEFIDRTFVDNVRIAAAAVPEPSSLMLLGIVGSLTACTAARRRRTSGKN